MVGFEILSEIHRGARYVVARGRRVRDGASVLVKSPRQDLGGIEAAGVRLRREYELLARLHLRGIARPVAFDFMAGSPALVLEDAGPQTLKEWQGHQQLTPERFLPLAIKLTETVVLLHEGGVLHRDINPWNVVVRDDAPTLVDFDAAVRLGDGGHPGVTAAFEAALPYIAPEETGRMNRLVDLRADLYSLGVVFYELLTGAPPFITTDALELVHAHLARAPAPPIELSPCIPRLLSELVLRLLAKMPEVRYQSAAGLLADLREAQQRLVRDGAITPFGLGTADLHRELPLPDTLYQRDDERAALFSAWQRARGGESMIALVSGPGGVGKSTLLRELLGPVRAEGGSGAMARFDGTRGNTPHAALGEALRQLTANALEQPPAEVTALKQTLDEALGPRVGLLTELCPALSALFPAPPALPPLPPLAADRRFEQAVITFVGALASANRPVALLADDLQWGDGPSLRLVAALAHATIPNLLLAMAWRADEPGPVLPSILADLDGTDRVACRLHLGPLDEAAVTALCADVLRAESSRARPLAALIARKTAGNPFFVRRLLRYLHQSRLLVYDAERATWTWDLEALLRIDVTDNVVDLLTASLEQLPEQVRRVVVVAAFLGRQIPVALLGVLTGADAGEAALRTAIAQGYLVPGTDPGSTGEHVELVHERVREAAQALVPPEQCAALHLHIGHALEGTAGDGGDARLFAIAHHLNQAAGLIRDPIERARLVEINLRAAQVARTQAAYGPALAYLEQALALRPRGEAGDTQRLHREAMECAYVVGDVTLAETHFRAGRALTTTRSEAADLYRIHVAAHVGLGTLARAFTWAFEGLRLFGLELDLPVEEVAATTRQEIEGVQAALAGTTPAEVLNRPPMRDPDALALMRLYSAVLGAMFVSRPDLFDLVVTRMIALTLQHGRAPASATAFSFYALLARRRGDDLTRAHAYGKLGVDLARKSDDRAEECRTLAIFGSMINGWTAPLPTTGPLLRLALTRGLETGELLYGASAASTAVMYLYHQGLELPRVLAEIEATEVVIRRLNVPSNLETLRAYRQAIHCLMGQATSRGRWDDFDCDDPRWEQRARGHALHGFVFAVRRLETAVVFRDLECAQRMATAARANPGYARSFVLEVELTYYAALTLLGRASEVTGEARAALLTEATPLFEELGRWVAHCPENHGQKHCLIAAELARLQDHDKAGQYDAAELYDQAIERAVESRFVQDEALASELCGRFHRAAGRKRFARQYLVAAMDAYARWGARSKVEALAEEFPELAGRPFRSGEKLSGDAWALDHLVLVRAAETISAEVVLDRLLVKLMEICFASAGAERGVFLLEEDGQLFVRAVGSAAGAVSTERVALDVCRELPPTVIARVLRTREPLVLADAADVVQSAQLPPEAQPYLAQHGVRSLLVLPVARKGGRMSVLYLENRLASGVFTPDRVRLLQLLSSQVAISIENSLLFAGLQREVDERKRAEKALSFLADAGAALVESLDYRATLARVARLAITSLADWCIVDVVEEGVMRRVAAAHRDPAREPLLHEFRTLQERSGPPRTTRVMDSGQPLIFNERDEDALRAFVSDPAALRVLEQVGLGATMMFPLRARDRTLGAVTFVTVQPGRRWEPADVELARELARRAAIAIDNARLYSEAQEAIRLRDDFLSIASHELNTPIASLQLAAQSLAEESLSPAESLGRVPVDVGKMAALITRQSRRLNTLVSHLLDVTRISAGDLRLRREIVELGGLVRETSERMAQEAARAGCLVQVDADAPVVGAWDRLRVEQVVTNLLSNAIKFSDGKPVTLRVSASGGFARLVVEDRGIGIPAGRLPHIFGRFERAVSAAHYGGLGLGLFIVREIVAALGGTCAVESEVGQGSRFTIELPLAAPGTP